MIGRSRLASLCLLLPLLACVREKAPSPTRDFLESAGLPLRASVLWVGAHSDDEALVAGALLAQLSRTGRRLFVLTLTRGEGTGIRGSEADEQIAAARAREYCLACLIYGAEDCVSERFPSRAHLTNSGDRFAESPEEVIETWKTLGPADPARLLEDWIRIVRPAWILTLDPDHGMYGHPEHRAVGKLVLAAARAMSNEFPTRVFAAENRFASLLPSNLDPGPVTLRVPGEVPCSPLRSCWQLGAEAVAAYASQGLPDFFSIPPGERFTNLRELPVGP
ncbi:MAG TPA: PIG-L deacetylase family protein [Thermoanaerobaculia bacterium]|nr:PIG-L deacetylase family protein [Thermoanaerobaculia bacterium]